jgi:hypothetical protein
MRLAVLAVVMLCSGCSTLLASPCDVVHDTGAGTLEQCSRRVQTAVWILGMPRVLADLEQHLPGVSDVAKKMRVRVRSARFDARVGGQYLGYHGKNEIELFVREGDNVEPRFGALAHEWAHAWEHQVQGYDYETWAASPHFVEQERIGAALRAVRTIEAEEMYCYPL